MSASSVITKPSRGPHTVGVPQVSPLRPGNHSARWTRFAGPALILLAAAIASAPIWFHGPVAGDDFEFHFVSWLNAQQSWLHGVPYPHWATSANFGAGEPRFVFYPPLTWMLGAALGLILPWTLVPVVITFLLLAATGLATRSLARNALPDVPATLAGCAVLFSGYTLFTAYHRTAFAELAGGFWIPLLLLFALRDRNPSAPLWRRSLDGSALPLSLVLAGCWLSDAPVGVMASYLLAAVALAAALLARSWFPVLRASIAFALGVALPAFYLIPAAWEQRWVDILQVTGVSGDPGLRIENNWLFPHHSNLALNRRDAELHFVSLLAVSMIAVALLSLFVLWLRERLQAGGRAGSPQMEGPGNGQPIGHHRWIPLACIPAAVLFLLLPVSLPVWNLLPKLRFLQFPWRWLLVVEAPTAIFFAAAVWPRKSARRWPRPAVAGVCALFFMAATIFAARNFFRDDPETDDITTFLSTYLSGAGFIGTDEYAPPGADNYSVATGLPDACLTSKFDTELGIAPNLEDNPVWRPDQGSCMATATAQWRQPEHMRLATFTPQAGFLILRLRTYPAWRITVNGKFATGLPARLDGLMAVPVPQGPVVLRADWTTTSDVITGRCVSVVALLGLIALGLKENKLSRPEYA
ncbi:MAG TPA: hypothetical protein VMQ56_11640 [Terracidiphilus sp.]|nr:hypothetical protein [Terracidiphilus sp.]